MCKGNQTPDTADRNGPGGSQHYFCPVPPQVGQVIFPTPEHLGHSFPFTFLAPLHIGHDIVFWPLQDLQLICHLSILYSEVLKSLCLSGSWDQFRAFARFALVG